MSDDVSETAAVPTKTSRLRRSSGDGDDWKSNIDSLIKEIGLNANGLCEFPVVHLSQVCGGSYMVSDPYEVLGVSRDAPMNEIKKALRIRSQLFHPDLLQDRPEAVRREGESQQQKLNDAYHTILKMRQREDIERERAEQQRAEGERTERERAEQQRADRVRRERDLTERQRVERERAARERAEWERAASERAARDERSRHRRISVVLVSMVAFLGAAGVAGLWHFAGGKKPLGLVHTLADPNPVAHVQAVAFSPSSGILAAGDDADKVYLWNATNGQQIAVFTGPSFAPDSSGSGVNAVAFNPGGNILAVGDYDGTYLLNVPSGKKIATVTIGKYLGGASAIAFSPGGNVMATGYSNDHTYLWRLSDDRKRANITVSQAGIVSGGSNGVAFSPHDGMLATIDSGGRVHLWKFPGEREVATLIDPSITSNGNTRGAVAVAFNPNGKMLATGDSDGNVYLWELPGDHEIAGLKGSGAAVNAVSFSMNGETLAAQDNHIDVWKVSNKQKISTFAPDALSGWQGLALDSKAGVVASGDCCTGHVVLLRISE